MYTYFCYGLVISSEFKLTSLHPIAPEPADVIIRQHSVSPDGLEAPNLTRALAQIKQDKVWMDIPCIARYLVSDGKEIVVEPYENADEPSIAAYLLGSAMGAILHQRGCLVLHASAVQVGEGAVLFCGKSGEGKSTLAAALQQKGFHLLSDDVVPIDQNSLLLGGLPKIKLWQDSLEQLGISKSGLQPVRPKLNKFNLPIESNFSPAEKLPIRAIYFIRKSDRCLEGEFIINSLEGMPKFNLIKLNTYRRHFMQGMGLMPRHFELCTNLSKRVSMKTATRPEKGFTAHSFADAILDDLGRLELAT